MIFVSHGITSLPNQPTSIHRNLLDAAAAEHYLKTRVEQFAPISEAQRGDVDALTIDDATVAAYNLAKVARKHGHEVTLFINPYNVIKNLPHSFVILSVLTDLLYPAQAISAAVRQNAEAYRRRLKEEIAPIRSENGRIAYLLDLGERLGQRPNDNIPDSLATLNRYQLVELLESGVVLGNHGWEHLDYRHLAPLEMLAQFERAHEWLREFTGAQQFDFAVPFGEVTPQLFGPGLLCDQQWFLADQRMPYGMVANGVFNRPTLKI